MERHQKMQEDIAEDMISIARSLRHNSLAAKEIITGDNQVGTAMLHGARSGDRAVCERVGVS